MRKTIVLGLLAAAACAPSTDRTDPAAEAPPDPRMIQIWKQEFLDFAAALTMARSDSPSERARGLEKAASMAPYEYFGWLQPGDQALIARARTGDKAAITEVGRRAEVLDAVIAFTRPYNRASWDHARRRITAQGRDMASFLAQLLVNLLLQSKNQEHYGEMRRLLVETGEPAKQIVIATVMTYADHVQDTPIGRYEELTQLLAALAMFGTTGAEGLRAAAESPKKYVRVCLVRAIGVIRGLEHLALVKKLMLEDEDWEVRSSAAESIGNLRGGERSCGALLEGLKRESSRPVATHRGDDRPGLRASFVLEKIVFGLGRSSCVNAIPQLMGALSFVGPLGDEGAVAERAMEALYDITGERIASPHGWEKWYREKYPKWLADRKAEKR